MKEFKYLDKETVIYPMCMLDGVLGKKKDNLVFENGIAFNPETKIGFSFHEDDPYFHLLGDGVESLNEVMANIAVRENGFTYHEILKWFGLSRENFNLLADKAKEVGESIATYINNSKYNYVIMDTVANKPFHWESAPADWVTYADKDEAEDVALLAGNAEVITEYEYLTSLGLDIDLKVGVKYRVSSGSSYPISLVLLGEEVRSAFHSGECSEDVRALMQTPEVKEQLDRISDKELNDWWGEMFVDDTEEEHASASKETKLSWLIFDACANAIDGDWEIVEV